MGHHQDDYYSGDDPAEGHPFASDVHLLDLLVFIEVEAFAHLKPEISDAFEDRILLEFAFVIFHKSFFQGKIDGRVCHSDK
jgi:hypothetical protein